MNRIKKAIALTLGGILFITSLTPSASVLAEEGMSNSNVETTNSPEVFYSLSSEKQREIIRAAAAEENIYIPKYPDRGVGNSAFRIAQYILKNRTKITNIIGKVVGRKEAVNFGEALRSMEGPLRSIDRAKKGGKDVIKKVIYNALRSVGVPSKNANVTAHVITSVIDALV
ncbi:hypothetical protein FC52_GL001614 [Lactobacillus pasteurii DSM 23907 = CRBIP 24.76]|uniref:Uncharacterized protein n=1 Tax=Lactobacillus pasteurii DSM 23907 = CRBIP 24.76 TaxID=1423790 RepID=I7KKR5_9LACO|nr:hypothetical protein [Lactobacillus pasteurii]KRK07724.1 hypothetical protein FC52_GL001614 [Lactobacillus pasteurii DSM 23907 = CRBIP 24.76]TDG77734.1 hypothetical protein C5L33_000145 [Lactobacillus pasteurii]CCI84734.1 Putative uncharacterized protein [Lactobacillus pasteurii DSM 23907 = CRBIP 24.76]